MKIRLLSAIRPNTKIIFGETLGNPGINVFPFEEVAAIGREFGIPLMTDSTFATPYLYRMLYSSKGLWSPSNIGSDSKCNFL